MQVQGKDKLYTGVWQVSSPEPANVPVSTFCSSDNKQVIRHSLKTAIVCAILYRA